MTQYRFSRKRALEYIASATNPVSRTDLISGFLPSDTLGEQIDSALSHFKSKHLVSVDSNGKFKATAPYADTVYATVTNRSVDSKRMLQLWGRPEGSVYSATLSDKQIKKHKLEAGDTIVVTINPGKGLQRAAKVLKKCDAGKPVHIHGYFNERGIGSAPFEAADAHIKTRFKLINDMPDFDAAHRGVYDAILPLDMKINDPKVILLQDTGVDIETGADINRVLLRKHGVPYQFSAPALMEAATLEHRAFSKSHRMDLTGRNFITIDPPGAQDLDDACAIDRIENGWRLTVAVADIDEFVTEGMALDRESFSRGNTFYLPERNFTLYPHDLTMRCSLLYNQDRPVGIYEAYFDDSGNILHGTSGFGFIRTRAQLTYDQYYEQLHQGNNHDLRIIDEFHQTLRDKFWNAKDGRSMANRIFSNQETGYVSHGFIETAMVVANQGLATELHNAGLKVPFRNHGPIVNPDAYKKMTTELRYLGFEISENPYQCDWPTLDNILATAEKRGIKSRVEEVLRNDFFDRAFYQPESHGHFALGIPHYCHATSPLRRKPDSYIWRGLRSLKGIKKGALSDTEMDRMPEICDHLQHQNRVAKDIESDRNKWRLIKSLTPGEERRATILHVNTKSVEIMLSSGLRNRLSAEMLAVSGWSIDGENRQIVRTANGQEERLGRDQHIRGKIDAVKPLQALWDFTPTAIPE